MTFKPKIWFPIAAIVSAINVAAVWFAADAREAPHALIHAVLGVAFGIWAQRLSGRLREADAPERLSSADAIESLDAEVGSLRQELLEAEERIDFAERMLAQGREQPDQSLVRRE